MIDGTIETRLEFTTKGGQTCRISGVDVGKRIAAIIIWLALLRGVVDTLGTILLLHVDGARILLGRHRGLNKALVEAGL
jgi:hypothetical protein